MSILNVTWPIGSSYLSYLVVNDGKCPYADGGSIVDDTRAKCATFVSGGLITLIIALLVRNGDDDEISEDEAETGGFPPRSMTFRQLKHLIVCFPDPFLAVSTNLLLSVDF